MNKFLIVLAYFEREEVVKNALNSIKNCGYDNYVVHFIDDGSIKKGEPVVREFYPELIDKFTFTYIDNTLEQKKEQGGSIHGKYLNEAIINSDADHVIILCDDDAIHPNFLSQLNVFLNKQENTNKKYFYHNMVLYDCLKETYYDGVRKHDLSYFTNQWSTPINCAGRVDSSQVTFDRNAFVNDNVRYPHPQTVSLDYTIFNLMFKTWGTATYSGLVSQVKSNNSENLVWRSNRNSNEIYNVTDIK